jgi:hypothetical protein
MTLTRYSSLLFVLHAPPISSSSTWSFQLYLAKSTSYEASTLLSKYSTQHPLLKHPQSMFLNVRDQVSQTYRTTSKVIALYVLMFIFFDSRQENRSLQQRPS